MAEPITPTHFDAVVISAGLPEVLIASALARAGKAVLVLDSTEGYGSSWASYNGADFVHLLINKSIHQQQQLQQQQQQDQAQQHLTPHAQHGAKGVDAGCLIPVSQEQLQGVQGCSLYTCPTLEQALDSKGLIIDLAPRVLFQDEPLVQLLVSCQAHHYLEFKLVEGNYLLRHGRLQPVPASRAALFADRALSLADKRSLGRFMAGCVEAAEGSGRLKDAFDGRPLAELLAAEGLDEQLQQVVLYGIAMADLPQQQQQQQQQQQSLTQPRQQEDPHQQQQQQQLPQQEQTQSSQQQPPAAKAEASPQPPAAAAAAADSATAGSSAAGPQQAAVAAGTTVITAAEGLAAFVLYSQSIGRYGGPGPFMAPCYGSGSLTEAFVRLAAVKGAVTALRQPTQHLQLLTQHEQQQAAQDAAHQQQQQQEHQQEQEQRGQQQPSGSSVGPGVVEAGGDAESASPPGGASAGAAGPTATAPPRVSVTLASGQKLTAGWVISSSSIDTASSSSGGSGSNGSSSGTSSVSSSGSAQGVAAARAVALLTHSLVEGDTSLMFVIPPGTLGPQQSCVIRGLQLGHALAVAPPAHCLLYLSALLPRQQQEGSQGKDRAVGDAGAADAATSSSSSGCGVFGMGSLAEQVLAPALAAVADTQHLQGLGMMSSGQQQGSQQVQSVQQDDMLEGQQQQQQGEVAKQQEGQQQQEQASASSAAQLRPQALAASFYTECRELPLPPHPQHQQQQQQQHTQQQPGSPAGLSSSDWVLRCPKAPVAGFAGYTASITAAEALFRHHFPDVPWLTDPLPTVSSAAAAAGGEEGGQQGSEAATGQQDAITGAAGGAAAGGVSDDELDAIDELTAALMELSSGLDEAPGQGSNAATQM